MHLLMNDNLIIEKLKEKFDSSILDIIHSHGMHTVTIDVKSIYAAIAYLKDDLGYTFLTDLCGIHYPDSNLQFGVIYHLHNFNLNERIRIKTFVSGENPHVPTLTPLFAGANWMERETFDFYGILFDGHPNLKRILNVEYLDYFPLRKEYPLEDPTREDKDDRFFGR
jgi:NADH-quinone oxidoreductase subunit C